MAKLGEAYVRVQADLKPFGKDLDLAIKRLTDRFEKDLNKQLGKKLGVNLGGGVRDGFRESMVGLGDDIGARLSVPANSSGRRSGRQFRRGFQDELADRSFITQALASLTSALEDGFSALPAPVKAAVGGAILTAVVPLGAFLTAAIAGGIIGGVAIGGVALSSQFEEVQDRWAVFADNQRKALLDNASAFSSASINSLDLFEDRLDELDPTIESIFDRAATFAVPLADGISNLVEGALEGLDRGLKNPEVDEAVDALRDGFGEVGDAVGDAFEILLTNPNLDVSLRDLLAVTSDLIVASAEFLNWTTSVYSEFRTGISFTSDLVENLWSLGEAINALVTVDPSAWDHFLDFLGLGDDVKLQKRIEGVTAAEDLYNRSLAGTVVLTEDQQKELKALNDQIEKQLELTNDVIGTQIDYQAAIDRTAEDLKEYGRSLDLKDEKGRRNAENVQREITALREQVLVQLQSGQLTEAQAETFYRNEIKRIRDRFKGNKDLLAQFDALFAKLIQLSAAPKVPDKFGPFRNALQPVIDALDQIIARQAAIRANALPSSKNKSGVGPGQQKYAEGGFIHRPTFAELGENFKPEVVLPLSDPDRSMSLLAQSPLADRIGGGPTVVYAIFDGEPFQARIVSTARSVNKQAARTLNQGPRNI